MASLTAEEVRTYIADSVDDNHLLDGVEFSDARIDLAKSMALDSYNNTPPLTSDTETTLRSKAVLLYGTLWQLFLGQSALAARNQMSYSDGGLTVPIEERYQFYIQLAGMYQDLFSQSAKSLKIAINMEAGWGSVSTDYATFPTW
jgi:hypothetical protein